MDGRPIMPAKHEIPLTGITFFKADQGLIKKAEAATDGLFHSLSTKIPATSLERFGIKAPKFIHGTIATGDEFVYSQKRTKAILAERPETNAVEMEGAAVAQVCSNYKVPFVVIRTISDKADHTSAIDFPAFINEIARHYSEHIVVSMLRAYSLMKKAAAIIKKLNLLPHPEGGYYRETHRATLKIDCTQTHGGERSAYTSIYFLLLDNDFSAWHKVASDETWLFHSGQDLNIYSIEKDGTIKTQTLGATHGVFQLTIPANTWFAAEINVNDKNDAYSLVSCTVAPGFDFKDFELARKENLVADFGTTPEKIHLLERLSKKDNVNHYAPRARL
jgi:predicted cupin superfamily sugar epimerase